MIKKILAAAACLALTGTMLGACMVASDPGEDESVGTVDQQVKPGTMTCGGFAGLLCPDGYSCVDDPSDRCDPDNGGADCPGICKQDKGKPVGEACNQVTCHAGDYCCNYSCSICAPEGGFCTQQICDTL